VQFCGRSSKLGKCCNGIANVRASRDVSIQQFTEKGLVGKTHFLGKCSVFWRAFEGANGVVEFVDDGRGQWLRKARPRLGLSKRRSRPMMSSEHAMDIGGTRDLGVVARLKNVDAVETADNALLFERGRVFARQL